MWEEIAPGARFSDMAGDGAHLDDVAAALLGRVDAAADERDAGELERAARTAADVLRAARREKSAYATPAALFVSGTIALQRGALDAARRMFSDALHTFTRHGDALRQIECAYLLGEIAYAGEDPIRAGALYRQGLVTAREIGAHDAVELLTLRFEHR